MRWRGWLVVMLAPSEHEPPAPLEAAPAPITPPPRAVRPATARPAAPAPPGAAAHRKPAVPAARKQRPSAPTIRQVTVAPTDVEVDGGQSTGLSDAVENMAVVDDDDVVIVSRSRGFGFPAEEENDNVCRGPCGGATRKRTSNSAEP